jgi:Thrombospondin type 3 repeat
VPDSDRDGIGDDEDLCKNVPQGKHPDPFKPGCPENDEDGDEVPDVDDACPVTPPGPNPDPKRPGCPFVDTDKDGVADADDACPLKPGKPNSDPTHNGCPMGKNGGPADNSATPSEPLPEPSTVKKKHMKE